MLKSEKTTSILLFIILILLLIAIFILLNFIVMITTTRKPAEILRLGEIGEISISGMHRVCLMLFRHKNNLVIA